VPLIETRLLSEGKLICKLSYATLRYMTFELHDHALKLRDHAWNPRDHALNPRDHALKPRNRALADF
jgi:hypothetical protein